MQITSYDQNLYFFYGRFIIYVIIQYTKLLSTFFFALNLKIDKILWSMIWSYDLWSYLPPTILCRIPILTTLLSKKWTKIEFELQILSMLKETSQKKIFVAPKENKTYASQFDIFWLNSKFVITKILFIL